MKGIDKPRCEAVIGFWPDSETPQTCNLPGAYYRNPDAGGWPAHYKLCEAHQGLAQQREDAR